MSSRDYLTPETKTRAASKTGDEEDRLDLVVQQNLYL